MVGSNRGSDARRDPCDFLIDSRGELIGFPLLLSRRPEWMKRNPVQPAGF